MSVRSYEECLSGMQTEKVLLERRKEVLKSYLMETIRDEDWHGVMDAAADLREVDAKLEEVAWVLE